MEQNDVQEFSTQIFFFFAHHIYINPTKMNTFLTQLNSIEAEQQNSLCTLSEPSFGLRTITGFVLLLPGPHPESNRASSKTTITSVTHIAQPKEAIPARRGGR